MRAPYIAGACLLVSLVSVPRATAEVDLGGPNIEDIAAHLTRDPALPLVGVWKTACTDPAGLAIDRAGPRLYSISYCGPNGCFTPGTYRPNSTIVSDPSYRVLDPDRLEVGVLDGVSEYLRCE